MKKNIFIYSLLFAVSGFLFSCTTTQHIPYFEDLTDTSKIYAQTINDTYGVVLKPDDLITINVSSNNPEATAIFNLGGSLIQVPQASGITPSSTTTTPVNNSNANSYLLDKQGTIDFPVLGKIKASGLTITQLEDSLQLSLNKYLQAPVANIRLLNYKITVLGEVTRPATYTIPSERITVIDAIGMAGDLTIYGRRENVLLIREEDGQRKFIRLNLNNSNIFQSPYYYLKQNDIVYIEPNKAKVTSLNSNTLKTVGIIASVAAVIVLAIARLR